MKHSAVEAYQRHNWHSVIRLCQPILNQDKPVKGICITGLVFFIWFVFATGMQAQSYNIHDFGALGDGKTINTAAIQEAIDACAEAGGGKVVVPAGMYITGPVSLKDNVQLHLNMGANLKGSLDLDDYLKESRAKGKSDWKSGLILADRVKNIAITGRGTIHGNKVFNPEGEENMRGPHGILITNSEKILIRDVRVYEGSNYNIFLIDCKDANIDGISARGGWDGISLYHCTNVTINNANIQSGDDAIAGRGWVNVTVTNSVLNSSCNGIRIYGTADQVRVNNCIIKGPGVYEHRSSKRHNTITGITISAGRAEYLRNVHFSNLSIENVRAPFWIRTGEEVEVSNFTYSDIYVTGAGLTASYIGTRGEARLKNLTFRNIYIEAQGGGTRKMAESPIWGMANGAWPLLPAYGFYCERVDNLRFDNVRVVTREADQRPFLYAHDVNGMDFYRLETEDKNSAGEPFRLEDVRNVNIRQSSFDNLKDTQIPVVRIEPQSRYSGSPNLFYKNEPVTAVMTVRPDKSGLADLRLDAGGNVYTKSKYLVAGNQHQVKFTLDPLPSGRHIVKSGQASANLEVKAVPAKPAFHVAGVELYHRNSDNYILSNVKDDLLFNDIIAVSASVTNWGGKTGAMDIPFNVDGEEVAVKKLDLEPGETKRVSFEYQTDKAGEHQLQVAGLPAGTITVARQLDPDHPHFASTRATFAQSGDKYRIRAEGRNLLALGINDLYGTIYEPKMMDEKTTVTVKLFSPNLRGGVLKSRMGIMVRNDITKPEESSGYLFIGMSHNNGCSMEWDGNGDGFIDTTTVLSGYTQWPCWLKLEKDGQIFTGYHSLDGKNWRKIGTVHDPEAREKQDVGMFVCGSIAFFEDFNITRK